MARRAVENPSSNGHSKIEVFYAKAEGSTQSLQDLMKALTQAIGRTTVIPTTARLTGTLGQPASEAEVKVEGTLFDPNLAVDVDSPESPPEDESLIDAPGENGRRKRGAGPKVDRNAGLVAVPDVDFIPDDKQPLRQFFTDKSPSTDMEQVLVLCHYLQFTAEVDRYGAGHLLSAFRHVGKPIPVDLRSTLRNMKDKKGWLRFPSIDDLRLTTEGENAVEHDLPRIRKPSVEAKA